MDPRALRHYYSQELTGIDLDSLPQLREHHCGAVCWFRGDSWQNQDGTVHHCRKAPKKPQERADVPSPPKPVADTTFAKKGDERGML